MKYFVYVFYRLYAKYSIRPLAYIYARLTIIFFTLLYLLSFYLLAFPEINLPKYKVTIGLGGLIITGANLLLTHYNNAEEITKKEFHKTYKRFHSFLAVLYIVGALALLATMVADRRSKQRPVFTPDIQNTNRVDKGYIGKDSFTKKTYRPH
jgi:hypothetical protein